MIADDLEIFFKLDEFAEIAHIGAYDVPVIFDNSYKGLNTFLSEVSSAAPVIHVRDKDIDLNNVEHGTILELRKKMYQVTSLEPDGTGITIVHLTRDF